MKWTEVKRSIDSLSDFDKTQIELTAAIVTYLQSKRISHEELAELTEIPSIEIKHFEELSPESFCKNLLKITNALDLSLELKEKEITG